MLHEVEERFELIGRVNRNPHDVLGQRKLGCISARRNQLAGQQSRATVLERRGRGAVLESRAAWTAATLEILDSLMRAKGLLIDRLVDRHRDARIEILAILWRGLAGGLPHPDGLGRPRR